MYQIPEQDAAASVRAGPAGPRSPSGRLCGGPAARSARAAPTPLPPRPLRITNNKKRKKKKRKKNNNNNNNNTSTILTISEHDNICYDH